MIQEDAFRQAKVLVVSEDSLVRDSLTTALRSAEFDNVDVVEEASKAAVEVGNVEPDIILLDLDMDGGDGIEYLQRIKLATPRDVSLPLLAFTDDADLSRRRRAFVEGANDIQSKPIDGTALLATMRNLLEIRLLSMQLAGGEALDDLVDRLARQRTQAQEEIQLDLLSRFARAAEYAGEGPGQHAEGVQFMSMMLARMLGFPEDQAQLIGKASLLHDVGKVGVPEQIWGKPGKLTDDEYTQVKEHTAVGGDLLKDGRSPLLWLAEEIARYHHERWDGTGYHGLAGEQIPIAARIVAVADAYDALTNDRPYRPALNSQAAIDEIKRERDHQFDPRVVDAFLGAQGQPVVS